MLNQNSHGNSVSGLSPGQLQKAQEGEMVLSPSGLEGSSRFVLAKMLYAAG